MMKSPVPKLSLRLYLALTDSTIGALLTQENEDQDKSPVYYVSRQLHPKEKKYPSAEQAMPSSSLCFPEALTLLSCS